MLKPNLDKKFFDYVKEKTFVERVCPLFKVERIISPLEGEGVETAEIHMIRK